MIIEKFNISAQTNPYDVAENVWKSALEAAKPDPTVGIRIAEVKDEGDCAVFVAAVPAGKEVGAHFHDTGDETYYILSAPDAVMCAGSIAQSGGSAASSAWESAVVVKEKDFITIDGGEAHQLKNMDTSDDLVFLFRCPRSHLTKQNHTMIKRAPNFTYLA